MLALEGSIDHRDVFFSAHGVPKSYVEEAGDPYQQEIETCARLIMEKLAADLGVSVAEVEALGARLARVRVQREHAHEAGGRKPSRP